MKIVIEGFLNKYNRTRKVSIISEEELNTISPLINRIKENLINGKKSWEPGNQTDFNIELNQNEIIPSWYKLYCDFPDYVLELFNKYVPLNICEIIEIKLELNQDQSPLDIINKLNNHKQINKTDLIKGEIYLGKSEDLIQAVWTGEEFICIKPLSNFIPIDIKSTTT